MTTLSKLNEMAGSCGNYLRGTVEVAGKEFRIEADVNKTWLNIIDQDSRTESCVIDEDGDVISESGEHVTQDWSPDDWRELTKYAGAKPQTKEVDLKNGDAVTVKQDPCGDGWVIAGRQTGGHTGQIYDNGDEVTSEIEAV